jgi:hypothetical protein
MLLPPQSISSSYEHTSPQQNNGIRPPSLTGILTEDITQQWDKSTRLVTWVLSSYNIHNQEQKYPTTMYKVYVNIHNCDFALIPLCKCDLRPSGTLHSVQW